MEIINFEDTRPYNDSEIHDAIQRMVDHPYFPSFIASFLKNADIQNIKNKLLQINSVQDFQIQMMLPVFLSIIKHSVAQYSDSGFDALTADKNYMFISNHRDITLDSGFLQFVLHQHNLDTSEITFGSNLMKSDWFLEMGKINKMFKLERGGTPKDIFQHSLKVSQYMRYAITEKKQSVWIAQRNGRTKDGDDKTEIAVLKMFSMSSSKDFVQNLEELNITPLSISYEYEPCDFMKTREMYISRNQTYKKAEGEDFLSIQTGLHQWKGNMHLSLCPTITHEELTACDQFPKNEKFKHLAQLIDQRIYTHYHLWNTNYIAYDLLNHSNDYQSFYTKEEQEKFVAYAQTGLQKIEGDPQELMQIFFGIYANPVKNKLL
ncbi:MAG: acyltransferase [Bacteroidales bacterium]|nr:acyltransferase [Bacteroidales bacterium]